MYSKTQGHHCWWLNKDGKCEASGTECFGYFKGVDDD